MSGVHAACMPRACRVHHLCTAHAILGVLIIPTGARRALVESAVMRPITYTPRVIVSHPAFDGDRRRSQEGSSYVIRKNRSCVSLITKRDRETNCYRCRNFEESMSDEIDEKSHSSIWRFSDSENWRYADRETELGKLERRVGENVSVFI